MRFWLSCLHKYINLHAYIVLLIILISAVLVYYSIFRYDTCSPTIIIYFRVLLICYMYLLIYVVWNYCISVFKIFSNVSFLLQYPTTTILSYDTTRKKEPSATFNTEREACLKYFEKWSETDQVEFVENLLARMCHYQHGHINSYLKPMLQRDFISLLPSKFVLQKLTYYKFFYKDFDTSVILQKLGNSNEYCIYYIFWIKFLPIRDFRYQVYIVLNWVVSFFSRLWDISFFDAIGLMKYT